MLEVMVIKLSKENARDAVYDIVDNVSLNPLTKTPEFVYPVQSIGADKASQIKKHSRKHNCRWQI